MDTSSPVLPQRSSYSSVNGSEGRSKSMPAQRPTSLMDSPGGGPGPPASSSSPHQAHVVRVTVVRDDRGYGMKVSGDKPVYVQSVKEGGAAERAGLHAGDKILRVNGVNVISSTHTDVVQLIRSSNQVELTVQQKPSPMRVVSSPSPRPSISTRITGPQPVDNEVQHQLALEREQQYRMMIEKEKQHMDKLRSQLAACHNDKIISDLTKTERNVQMLQDVLAKLLQSQQSDTSITSPQSPSSSTLPPPPPLPKRNAAKPQPPNSPLLDNCLYSSSTPPPLPPRNDQPNSISKQMAYPLVATCATLCNNYMPNHQRTKSSPDPLLTLTPAEASKRLIASESMNDLSRQDEWGTPPGTPPPPYPCPAFGEDAESPDGLLQESSVDDSPIGGDIHAATPHTVQQPIISMEDDDVSDQEMNQVEEHGPFKSLSKLWEHLPHLAVFTNYVLSNSDPDCLLFYLLTDLYKEGNAKEMRKWAFEIHSCFLVPGAPLRLPNVDENVAREIDDVLTREYDKEEILRKIFWKARSRAKEELTKQLTDFKQKRTAGLGTMFGPTDSQLNELYADKGREQRLYESIFQDKLEPYLEEFEKENYNPRKYFMGAALATVVSRIFGVRVGQGSGHIVNRWPTFVSKDKSIKARLMGRSHKMNVQGHTYVAHQYLTVIVCNNCHQIIYGISPQGYQCSVCQINLHRACVRLYDDSCPGPIPRKDRGLGKFIRMRHDVNEHRRRPTQNFIQMERRQADTENHNDSCSELMGENRPTQPVSRSGSDRRPEAVREERRGEMQEGSGSGASGGALGQEHAQGDNCSSTESGNGSFTTSIDKRRANANISRSESVKEQSEKRKQRRNISDPSHNSHNSANSDMDHSAVSGSTSLQTDSGNSSNSSICNGNGTESPNNTSEEADKGPDSEKEADADLDWQSFVPADKLQSLQPHEKKRQDVIHELFQTEHSHVRSLKVLYKIFYKSIVDQHALKTEELELVFPNIKEVLEVHTEISREMRQRRKQDLVVTKLGDMMEKMFGEKLRKSASTFCERQQLALEFIKERRKRDSKLEALLVSCEKKPQCRRLQLQGILPVEMQRLSKYPLLLERLISSVEQGASLGDEDAAEELIKLRHAYQQCKELLKDVNEAAKLAMNKARLKEIQRHLDTSSFERSDHPITQEYRNINLANYNLLLEGAMQLRRNNKNPVPIYMLLLEEVVVLLQREGERYLLKFFQSGSPTQPQPLSPIIKTSTLLVRTNAVHKNALFLVNTSSTSSQMYDLLAEDDQKREQWFKHLSEASDACNKREGKTRRPETLTTSEEGGDSTSSGDRESSDHQDNEGECVREMDQPEDAVPERASSIEETTVNPQSDSGSPDVIREGEGEHTRITAEDWPLIQPSQVQIASPPVHTAESMLTPLEQIRRKDEEVRQALAHKEELVADLLNIPREHFDHIADMAGESKGLIDLVLAAMHQSDQLQKALNRSLDISEGDAIAVTGGLPVCASQQTPTVTPSVPAQCLAPIASALSTQLTSLLSAVKRAEEEKERYRKEVARLREQLHQNNELHPTTENVNDEDPEDEDQSPPPV